MPRHPDDTAPLESEARLQRLVRYNEAICDCLALSLQKAEHYDTVCEILVACRWPGEAAQKALQYQPDFPWMAELFTPREPAQVLPAGTTWGWVEADVFNHREYQRRVDGWTRTYFRGQLSEDLMYDMYLVCLPRVVRHIIGRGVIWPKTFAEYCANNPTSRRTWLEFALNWADFEIQRSIRVHLGLPPTDKTGEDADGVERKHLLIQPETNVTGPGPGDHRPTEEAPGRELPPEAIALANWLRLRVHRAVARLEHRLSRVIKLRLFRELSWEETAAALHEAQQLGEASTAKQRIALVKKLYKQARDELKKALHSVGQ
jgi:hypothetical protein